MSKCDKCSRKATRTIFTVGFQINLCRTCFESVTAYWNAKKAVENQSPGTNPKETQ